jgi:hypothetical protein
MPATDSSERDYSDTMLVSCVAEATRAPSAHNTQPWHFRVRRECVELIADRSRALPVNDPDDRELTISCGAALFTLRVALAARGYSAYVETLPVASDPDLLARITPVTGYTDHIEDTAMLMPAVEQRRTYRKAFIQEDMPLTRINLLCEAANRESATLVALVEDSRRRALVELVEQADQKLWQDARWRRELSAWMHPRRRGEGFGIPGLAHAAAQLVARTFDPGTGNAARGEQILEGSPLLVVLCSPADTPLDWLAAGQALQRVLLRACTDDMQASYLNQPLHLADYREKVAGMVPLAGMPQIILRLGRPADQLAPVVRRPLDYVMDLDWMGH